MKKPGSISALILMCSFFLFSTSSIAQWVQTNGPSGNIIYALAANGPHIFAGTDKGLFISTNNGDSWTLADNSFYPTSFLVYNNKVFAGNDNGVFRSTDNGASWNNVFSSAEVYSLGIRGPNIFAGSTNHVFRSTNEGDNWTDASFGLPTGFTLPVSSFTTNGISLIAGTSAGAVGGAYITVTDGDLWAEINNGLTNTNVNALAISNTNLYAGTSYYGSGFVYGIYKSTDFGQNWIEPDSANIRNVSSFIVTGSNIFAGTTGGVVRSTDEGSSWVAVNNGLDNLSVKSLAENGSYLFAGTDGGVFRSSDNGSSWSAANLGFTGLGIKTILVSGSDIFSGTTNNGIFRSTDDGISWNAVNNGILNLHISSMVKNGSYLFASALLSGGEEGDVYRSTDNGTNWFAFNNNLPTNQNVWSLTTSGNNIFAGIAGITPAGGVFLSPTDIIDWTNVSQGLTNKNVQRVILKDNNLFAGTSAGVFRSTDFGSTWTRLYYLNNPTIWDVLSFGVSDSNLFVGTNGGSGLFLTTDEGTSWVQINTGLLSRTVRAFAFSGTSIFVATDAGVFLSNNNGANWTDVSDGLPGGQNKYIGSIAIKDNELFAGNFTGLTGGSVWKRPLSEMITDVKLNDNKLPENFVLNQNYPNPFNPGTTISFSLPAESFVTLKVFDVLGREVSILVSKELPAGTYSENWDASRLSSGVYFYQLKAGNFIQTKKLELLR